MAKTKLYLLIIFFLFISSVDIVLAYSKFPLINKLIYIDAGHGGIDPGAIYKDLRESDINLIFSKKVGKLLENKGATVYYIRDGDYDLSSTKIQRKRSDLSNRVSIINESNASLYLSFHVNSEQSSTWYGTQIFYSNILKQNKKIASIIRDKLYDKGIIKRQISLINNTYMYDRIKVPGVLIEVGFISNYVDRNKMQSSEYIEKFSRILVSSIETVLK